MVPLQAQVQNFNREVADGQRFEFGKNWKKFLAILSDERISEAEESLKRMLRVESLAGRTFIDVGSGSGLFSLAARRLGARVCSFDYDPSSVWCTNELRRRYFPDDPEWKVLQGSILDADFVATLGSFDIVYSWGVLHHTGDLWKALEVVRSLVAPRGLLFIALYNNAGRMSTYWLGVKRSYCRMPRGLKGLVLYPAFVQIWAPRSVLEILKGRPFHTWRNYYKKRGMTAWRDVVDWVGGYPYEPSEPKDIFLYYYDRGYELRNLTTTTGLGINQFVFERMRG